MNFSQQKGKKLCVVCYSSPENILVLACDHTVCLQCAYLTMPHPQSMSNQEQIQFNCQKCRETTYFDRDLVKQIESTIRSKDIQQKSQKRPVRTQSSSRNYPDSVSQNFIQKMRKQYFSDNPKLHHSQNDQNFGYDRQRQSSHQNFNQKIAETVYQNSKGRHFSHNGNDKPQVINQDDYRPKNSRKQEKCETQPPKKQKNLRQTKCSKHLYYELIYFCMDCRQVVCSECLLRGQHYEHSNQSISQILERQLPDFLNQTSQELLIKVKEIEQKKGEKFNQINQKLNEVKKIRQNTILYFKRVRKNIQKEQQQVLEKCNEILNNIQQEQRQQQNMLKSLENSLAKNIQDLKQLKISYKELSNLQDFNTQRKRIEKSLIHQYLNCSKSVNWFLVQKNQEKVSQKVGYNLRDQSTKVQNDDTNLQNQSDAINQKFIRGIKSIRDSLTFQNISKTNQMAKHKHEQEMHADKLARKINQKTQQSKFSKNGYISYASTENSQKKTKKTQRKQRDKSISISPYKHPVSRHKCKETKPTSQIQKRNTQEITRLGKENIHTQSNSFMAEIKSQLLNENQPGVSAKKIISTKNQKSRQNSKSNSNNNSITKSKKKNPITNQYSSVVNRFKP